MVARTYIIDPKDVSEDPLAEERRRAKPGEVPCKTITEPGLSVTTIEVPAVGDIKLYQNLMHQLRVADGLVVLRMSGMEVWDKDVYVALQEVWMEISEDVEARPIFIITVCQGAVRGYQMMLPAFASVCLADPEATFGMPEVRLGAMPAVQTVLLRRRLTEDNIRRLMMSTDPIDAYEAQRVGLVDFVGDVEMELARLIQKNCQPKTMVQFYKPDLERAWAEAEE
mmetsp:Transcript_24672/g.56974  ORF Transcript_24672/g.56974 Transcript_24672/m.56974 type:complete len:225 (-) Transcript_24672:36-710(-)